MQTIEEKLMTKHQMDAIVIKHSLNWINSEWVDADNHSESFNPATGARIGSYADGGEQEAQKAVASAMKAFKETLWKTDYSLRSRILLMMADRIELHSNDLIEMLCTECGKVVPEATMEVFAAPAMLRYWAGKTFTKGQSGEPKPGSISITIREAVGVAGIIVPFNGPVALSVRALAPALAAGTTTVVKMPGLTAQTNQLLFKIISAIPGLPKGVINMINESGNEVAKFLVKSPDVRVIAFTGSTKTGKEIIAEGAAQLKRFSLELGGKTPTIVFNDADIDAAIFTMEKSITIFSGQFCMTGSRILVQRDIAERVKLGLAERLSKVKVGLPSDASSGMGSMINKASVLRVDSMVEEAIASGAKVIVRGGQITEGVLSKGAFYRPVLLEVNDPEMPIVQQEIFGPVATLQVFDTEAEAVNLANNSEYGLAVGIWTKDVNRPWRLARAIEAGTVWINTYAQVFAQFEEGGYKHSGNGRLNGEAALDDFLEYKHISFNPGFVEGM